jgi:hypothetical protein
LLDKYGILLPAGKRGEMQAHRAAVMGSARTVIEPPWIPRRTRADGTGHREALRLLRSQRPRALHASSVPVAIRRNTGDDSTVRIRTAGIGHLRRQTRTHRDSLRGPVENRLASFCAARFTKRPGPSESSNFEHLERVTTYVLTGRTGSSRGIGWHLRCMLRCSRSPDTLAI